jgi:acyl carrier protein
MAYTGFGQSLSALGEKEKAVQTVARALAAAQALDQKQRSTAAERLEKAQSLQREKLMTNGMPTLDQTLDQIMNLAAAHFKVPREKLSPDQDFFKALGIDSLQTLDLLTRLEHHFHVELPDYELQGITDFRTLAGKIRARL